MSPVRWWSSIATLETGTYNSTSTRIEPRSLCESLRTMPGKPVVSIPGALHAHSICVRVQVGIAGDPHAGCYGWVAGK